MNNKNSIRTEDIGISTRDFEEIFGRNRTHKLYQSATNWQTHTMNSCENIREKLIEWKITKNGFDATACLRSTRGGDIWKKKNQRFPQHRHLYVCMSRLSYLSRHEDTWAPVPLRMYVQIALFFQGILHHMSFGIWRLLYCKQIASASLLLYIFIKVNKNNISFCWLFFVYIFVIACNPFLFLIYSWL